MKKDVVITIQGFHPDSTGGENIEMSVAGTLMHRAGTKYLSYEEADEEGRITNCRIKIADRTVTLSKTGNVSTQMEFTKGIECGNIYSTPYGDLRLGVCTKEIVIEERNDLDFGITLKYELRMDGSMISDCELKIGVIPVHKGI